MYHCGCHGNLVTKATKNVADAYHPKDLNTKYVLNIAQDKEIIEVSIWLPWQQGKWVMPIAPRNLHTKYELNTI